MQDALLAALDDHPDRVALTGVDGRGVRLSVLLAAIRAIDPAAGPSGGSATAHGGPVTDLPVGPAADLPPDVWVAVADPVLGVVTTLGCLRAHSVVLVGPRSTPAALDRLAGVSPPAAVVTDSRGSACARWADARGLLRLAGTELLDPGSGRAPTRRAARPHTALKFLTSGTTALPKVIPLFEQQILAATSGVAGRLGLGNTDVSLNLAPLNHTLGLITGVLTPLLSGGSVIFAAPGRPAEFVRHAGPAAVTWCPASPSIHRLVHQLAASRGLQWPSLRLLRSSAAPLPPDLAAQLEEYHQVPVVNAYVLSEAPGEAASQPLAGPRRPGTAGTPTLCEVQIRVADRNAGPGEEGTIWIRGSNVSTAAPGAPAVWTPTGDTGILDAANELTVTGRIDDVINRGGFKIAPHLIESAALQHPGIAGAAAFPIPHEGLGSLVGLVVSPPEGGRLSVRDVRAFVGAALPRRLWPDRIVVADRIATNERGKIARRRLAALIFDEDPAR